MFERFSKRGVGQEHSGSERTMVLSVSPKLFVLTGKKKGRQFKIDRDIITLGREKTNDICFENESSVSEKHARISRKEGNWFILDLGSAGGIVVDGRKVDEKILEDGSVIELGGVKLRFEEGRSSTIWRLYDRNKSRKNIYRLVILIVFLGIVLTVMRLLSSISNPKVTGHLSEDYYLHYVPVVEEGKDESDKDVSEKCYIMGMAEYNKGNFDNAVFYWNEVLKINPEHKNARIKLNTLEEEKKKSGPKRRTSRKREDEGSKKENKIDGTEKKHETAEMYYRKGRVFLAANDSKKALYYWKKVIKIIDDPEDELYRQTMEKINTLTGNSRQ